MAKEGRQQRYSNVLCVSLVSLLFLMPLHPTNAFKLDENMDPETTIAAFEAYFHNGNAHSPRLIGPERSLLSTEARAEAIRATARKLQTHEANNASYFLAWNPLSDLNDSAYREFLKSRPRHDLSTNRQLANDKEETVDHRSFPLNATKIPKQVDWRTIENGKYITPIKNQGTCGSCWAFSAVSIVESRFAIAHNVRASPLSVEQVLSCSSKLDHITSKYEHEMISSSDGCEGGMPFLAYVYMDKLAPHGIACDATYPYVMATAARETACRSLTPDDVAVSWIPGKNASNTTHRDPKTSDYVAIPSNDEEALLRAVMDGPVSANMDGESDGFRHYGGGIYDARDCINDGKTVNHAVVIEGFGETDDGDKYWVVRNTWGTMWGENGYMRIARGKSYLRKSGPCNLYLYSSYPVGLHAGKQPNDSMCSAPVWNAPKTTSSLSVVDIMALDLNQWLLWIGTTVVCLSAGLSWYGISEYLHRRQEAAGQLKYEDNYDRWILPTRDQIVAALSARSQLHAV